MFCLDSADAQARLFLLCWALRFSILVQYGGKRLLHHQREIDNLSVYNHRERTFFSFGLWFNVQVNSYGQVETVSFIQSG